MGLLSGRGTETCGSAPAYCWRQRGERSPLASRLDRHRITNNMCMLVERVDAREWAVGGPESPMRRATSA